MPAVVKLLPSSVRLLSAAEEAAGGELDVEFHACETS